MSVENLKNDSQSVAVYEVETDKGLMKATCGPGPNGEHAIKYIWNLLQEQGIKADQVRRIYSEVEPCRPPVGSCSEFIKRTFPRVEVTYSFPQKGT